MFSVNAEACKKAGYDGFYGCESVKDIQNLWNNRDVVYLEDGFKTENFESDIKRWETMALNEFLNDFELRSTLNKRFFEKGVKRGENMLLLLPANYMFGRGIYALLENMGYIPHIFIYEGHESRYAGLVPKERLHTFKNHNMYDFDKLKSECDTLKSRIRFGGSLMLVILPYVHLCTKDGYGNVVKIAEYMAEFIGCVNIRRTFSYFTEFNYE